MTPVKVVDASAVGAVVFNEPDADRIASALTGRLVSPTLLRYELASICLNKLKLHVSQHETILAAYRLAEGLEIEYLEVDYAGLAPMAHRARITVYDAAYLWLATGLAAELVTLDKRLAKAAVRQAGLTRS